MTEAIHQVRIAGTDQSFACSRNDTLMRAAQRDGLGFPYECNVGSCGNCRFELIEGEVESAWPGAPGLSEKDRQRGRQLGCQAMPRGDCTIKVRLAATYEPVHRPCRVSALLRARRLITHDIAEFTFELPGSQAFEPGQYALLQLPGVCGLRAYSMSNLGEQRRWDFQVRRVPDGAGTRALFELPLGSEIDIDGPFGMAWLRRDAQRDILCLAGGSGLAPMIAIARGAMTEPRLAGRTVDFVYGGRTQADLCGEDMLRDLPGWGQRLHYHPVVSLATDGDTIPYGVEVGFVHDAAQRKFGDALRDKEVYFAGPPAMVAAVQRMLLEAQVPPSQQHFDQFF